MKVTDNTPLLGELVSQQEHWWNLSQEVQKSVATLSTTLLAACAAQTQSALEGIRDTLIQSFAPLLSQKDKFACWLAYKAIQRGEAQELVEFTTKIMKLSPEEWLQVTNVIWSGEWETRDDPLEYIRAKVSKPKRGRPKGSGTMDRETFEQVVREAVIYLRRQGIHPSQERVADYMAYRLGSKHGSRQMRRWTREFGYASWVELLSRIAP